jgi:hypothetical protein
MREPATLRARALAAYELRVGPPRTLPNTKLCLRVEMALGQVYPPEYQRVQYAFKDSMIH